MEIIHIQPKQILQGRILEIAVFIAAEVGALMLMIAVRLQDLVFSAPQT